jgi:nucleotide-binding universal stress UspA family protein
MNEIVVGVDGSPTAREAARRAAQMASNFGQSLHIVMAVPRVVVEHVNAGTSSEKFTYDNVAEAEKMVKTLASEFTSLAPTTTTVVIADPATALCEEAERLGASVIVVGNKRVQGAARVLGSIAGHVTRSAPCDVLVVHTT